MLRVGCFLIARRWRLVKRFWLRWERRPTWRLNSWLWKYDDSNRQWPDWLRPGQPELRKPGAGAILGVWLARRDSPDNGRTDKKRGQPKPLNIASVHTEINVEQNLKRKRNRITWMSTGWQQFLKTELKLQLLQCKTKHMDILRSTRRKLCTRSCTKDQKKCLPQVTWVDWQDRKSNYGSYTAAQWKNFVLVHSVYVLQVVLPQQHLHHWPSLLVPERLRVLNPVVFFSVVKICKHWLVEEQKAWRRVATQIST